MGGGESKNETVQNKKKRMIEREKRMKCRKPERYGKIIKRINRRRQL